MKRLVRGEKGYVLIAALLVLVVLGLISGPLLSYMVSGLRAGHVFETGAAELYAADAGVEDAVLKIQRGVGLCVGQSTNYTISDVNGKSVDVTVTLTNNVTGILTYKITSIAVTYDGGNTAAIDSSTTVDAYVTSDSGPGDYSGILNGILTSQGVLDWGNKLVLNYTEGHEPAANYTGAWPDEPDEVENFARFYWMDVKNEPEFASGIVDLGGLDMDMGPVYRDGELEILNSSPDEATLSLSGTIYITGDTLIGTNGHEFILDLNGHTVFIESSSADPEKALWIGGKCTLKGPGCIIAVGDVYFEPNPDVGGEGEPVFAFSVLGATTIRPGVNMYGAVAGSVKVGVQTGSKPQIKYPVGGFEGLINFPGLVETKLLYSIASWEVSRQ